MKAKLFLNNEPLCSVHSVTFGKSPFDSEGTEDEVEHGAVFGSTNRDKLIISAKALKSMIDLYTEAGFSFEEAVRLIVAFDNIFNEGEDE